jgi:radical SAM superfamily enzyme YgiQ (UPF0313 family)
MQQFNENKLLLIHPLGYNPELAKGDISRKANIMPPLGLASIAAYLEKQGISVDIIDCYARPDYQHYIRDYLLTEKPAFIGFSCTTSSFLDGINIVRQAKNTLPGIKTVFGGPHVSALKEKVLEKFPEVDFSIVGEGESALTELITAQGEKADIIRGVVSRGPDGGIHFSGHREQLLELDSLPFPAYEKLLNFPAAYSLPIFNYPRTPNTSCISSRGCSYSCSYCDRSVFRRSFRYNSSEYLYEHVSYLKERFGIRHINFYDDQFTFNRKRVLNFTKMLFDRNPGITFNCAVRAEHIDSELLKQMKAAGCWMISLGIETGDENLLAQHRQKANLNLLRDRIGLINKAGIRVKGLLMMGLPGESVDSVQNSMDFVFSLPIDDINVAKFTPFPGSPLYEKISELGVFDEDWPKMDCMHFQFIPHGLERSQLEKMHREFYRRHFSRLKVLLSYLSMLWRSPDSWIRFIRFIGHFIKFAKSNQRHSSS